MTAKRAAHRRLGNTRDLYEHARPNCNGKARVHRGYFNGLLARTQSMPNVAKFAKALFALHQADCLKDPKCRHAVGMFVRQATETRHWHLTTHYRSKRAADEIAKVAFRSPEHYHAWCSQNLRHEHMVPIAEVIDMLVRESEITEMFITQTLRTNGLRATIHREEDAVLNECGLAKKMPAEYWTLGSPYYQDPLARYKVANLYECLVPLSGSTWFPSAG